MTKLCYLPTTLLLYIYPFTPQTTASNFTTVCLSCIDIKRVMIYHGSPRSLYLKNSCMYNKLTVDT